MVSKTRERLIEVARQLFVRKGVENTTMIDIANASEKGRRTIYTYFKNKREIHQAVIERESEQIISRQRRIQTASMSARHKLEKFLWTRYETLQCPTSPKSREMIPILNLLEGNRGGKARKLAVQKEIEILEAIIREGVDSGEFNSGQASRVTALIVMLMHGVDNSVDDAYFMQIGFDRDTSFRHAVDFILEGITA